MNRRDHIPKREEEEKKKNNDGWSLSSRQLKDMIHASGTMNNTLVL
jgi:hypothetical protein